MYKQVLKINNLGQIRLIEVILGVIIIVLTLITIMRLTPPQKTIYLRETSDLRRFAYNLLNTMANARVFEDIVVGGNLSGNNWEDEMKMFLSINMPPQIIFSADFYELRMNESGVIWHKLNRKPISNTEEYLSKIVEAESVTYTYVCVGEPDRTRGTVLVIILRLGYGG